MWVFSKRLSPKRVSFLFSLLPHPSFWMPQNGHFPIGLDIATAPLPVFYKPITSQHSSLQPWRLEASMILWSIGNTVHFQAVSTPKSRKTKFFMHFYIFEHVIHIICHVHLNFLYSRIVLTSRAQTLSSHYLHSLGEHLQPRILWPSYNLQVNNGT